MRNFMLMTACGTTPPKYVHNDIELAIAEGRRLNAVHKTKVTILEVVGVIEEVEVPVTKKEVKVTLSKSLEIDDIPF